MLISLTYWWHQIVNNTTVEGSNIQIIHIIVELAPILDNHICKIESCICKNDNYISFLISYILKIYSILYNIRNTHIVKDHMKVCSFYKIKYSQHRTVIFNNSSRLELGLAPFPTSLTSFQKC